METDDQARWTVKRHFCHRELVARGGLHGLGGALLVCACAVLLVLMSSGCGLLMSNKSSQHTGSIRSVQFTTNQISKNVSFVVLQGQVMRFADEYASVAAQAADDYAEAVNNSDARLRAIRWKLSQATAAVVDATGPSPALNLLDLLVLASLSRMVVEDTWTEHGTNAAALALLETHRKLEASIWQIVSGVLKPEQQQEVRELILEWRQKNPNQRYVGAIRFREFVLALGKSMELKSSKSTSVLGLLALDPLAGLDPTALAIEETRRTVERMMYYTQRMPFLLTWQVEMLSYQLADQPESQQIMGDVKRLAAASESFADTANKIPGLVKSEREAAIHQVFEEMRTQGDSALGVLKETRQTLDASGQAAASINNAIKSLDDFVRFVVPTNTTASSDSTNSRPFNVLDYGIAATQVAVAAKELNALLSTINGSTPQLAQMSEQASARADQMLNHAFKLGLVLILVLLLGLLVVAVIYRSLGKR